MSDAERLELLARAEEVYPDWPVGRDGGRCSVTLQDGTCCTRKAILGTGSDTICYVHATACLEEIQRRVGFTYGGSNPRGLLFWLAAHAEQVTDVRARLNQGRKVPYGED